MKLIYAGNPLSAWCYGFGKELAAFTRRHPELPLEIVAGGMRSIADRLDSEEARAYLLTEWERVANNSGLPFDRHTLRTRPLRVLDHEPVCRAVAVASGLAPPGAALAVFRALQHAHFVASLDVTDGRVLANLCSAVLHDQGVAIDASAFYAAWSSPDAIRRTRAGFARLRALGVHSGPTLLLDNGAELVELSVGYAHLEVLEMRLASHTAAAGIFLTGPRRSPILSA
jgi:putative protein-disulfide isomerase